MSDRKYWSAIDMATLYIQKEEKKISQRKIIGALFINVKGVYDYISQMQLVQSISDLKINDNLIG